MAELLIKAVDATHADPSKDARGCYKRGDVVVVKPDGHTWGTQERLPLFWVLKVPGLSVAECDTYLEPDALPEFGMKTRRRKYRLDAADLPKAATDDLEASGVATVAKARILVALKRKAVK